jgi:outer membrane protein OmpA-like peptidoglycan-associated protein
VLDYVFNMSAKENVERDWLVAVLRANGLSFANPVLNADGSEDSERSRRVEFRVLTKTEDKIYRILQKSRSDA